MILSEGHLPAMGASSLIPTPLSYYCLYSCSSILHSYFPMILSHDRAVALFLEQAKLITTKKAIAHGVQTEVRKSFNYLNRKKLT